MSTNEPTQALRRIQQAESGLERLRDRIETRSLRACLGLARAWLEEGSIKHADSICQEVVDLAAQLAAPDAPGAVQAGPTAPAAAPTTAPGAAPDTYVVVEHATDPAVEAVPAPAPAAGTAAADEPTPVGTRLVDLEHRLRDHFSRELSQAIAAKPWTLEKRHEERGHGSGLRDQLELVRASVEELRRAVQEGAAVSPAEVKALISAELEANGLESKVDRAVQTATTTAPAPPFVQRLDARLMQVAHAQERIAERLHGLERLLARMAPAEQAGPTPTPAATARRAEGTGSWLQELEAALPAAEPVAEPATAVPSAMPAAAAPAAEPSSTRIAAPRAPSEPLIEPTDAPTLAFPIGGRESAAGPVLDASTAATGPLERAAPRDDESRIRMLITAELARRLPATATAAEPGTAASGTEVARLAKALPDALRQPAVREALFALLAMEAAAHPGALAELTGVRSFLRRELARQVEELKKEFALGV